MFQHPEHVVDALYNGAILWPGKIGFWDMPVDEDVMVNLISGRLRLYPMPAGSQLGDVLGFYVEGNEPAARAFVVTHIWNAHDGERLGSLRAVTLTMGE